MVMLKGPLATGDEAESTPVEELIVNPDAPTPVTDQVIGVVPPLEVGEQEYATPAVQAVLQLADMESDALTVNVRVAEFDAPAASATVNTIE